MNTREFTKTRVEYAMKKVLKRSVKTMKRLDWESMINANGTMTQVQSLNKPFTNVMDQPQVVAVTACGFHAPIPEINIVRLDEKDAPFIYNLDNYTIVQTLCQHNEFETIVKKSGVSNPSELLECLSHYVFVVKNLSEETPNHWSEEIPNSIKNVCTKINI